MLPPPLNGDGGIKMSLRRVTQNILTLLYVQSKVTLQAVPVVPYKHKIVNGLTTVVVFMRFLDQ